MEQFRALVPEGESRNNVINAALHFLLKTEHFSLHVGFSGKEMLFTFFGEEFCTYMKGQWVHLNQLEIPDSDICGVLLRRNHTCLLDSDKRFNIPIPEVLPRVLDYEDLRNLTNLQELAVPDQPAYSQSNCNKIIEGEYSQKRRGRTSKSRKSAVSAGHKEETKYWVSLHSRVKVSKERKVDEEIVKRKKKEHFMFRDLSEILKHIKTAQDTTEAERLKYLTDFEKYKKAYSKVDGLRARLIRDENYWHTEILAYPAEKSKYGMSSRRQSQERRARNPQGAEGGEDGDKYPVQVLDAASESLDLPPKELVVTSNTSSLHIRPGGPSSTTNQLSVDAERSMFSRNRGQLQDSRFNIPVEPAKHQEYTDQPSRQRPYINGPQTTGQDPAQNLQGAEGGGDGDRYIVQVSDAASESLNLPPRELVVTSNTSLNMRSDGPSPTTSQLSVDEERSMFSRIRVQLPDSRLSIPVESPKHPGYTDQPSGQRPYINGSQTTGQGPAQNPQGAGGGGDGDKYIVQVSDAASESLDLPPRELVVTSNTSSLHMGSGGPSPTTNQLSVDEERSMFSRNRGQLQDSRFSIPVEQPKHQEYTDQPSRQRPYINGSQTTGQDTAPNPQGAEGGGDVDKYLVQVSDAASESRFSIPVEPPKHPEYTGQPSRQRSYMNWPQTTGQDPARMAIYGFFYTGRLDLVICFQCGVGLKDWTAADEPLLEHIRRSPNCPFLKDLLKLSDNQDKTKIDGDM